MIAHRLPVKINVALCMVILGIAGVFAAFVYPLERGRTTDQVNRVQVLLSTIYKQTKDDFANAIFAGQHLAMLYSLQEIEGVVDEITNSCLYDQAGLVQYCSAGKQEIPVNFHPLSQVGKQYNFLEFSYDEKTYGAYLNSIEIIGERVGYLGIYYDLSQIYDENLRLMVLSVGLFFLSLFIIIFLLNFFLFKAIINPINRLRLGMRSVANGNLGETVSLPSGDEIGSMGTTFNEMSLKLKQNSEVIERHRLNLEELVRERTEKLIEANALAEKAREKQHEQLELLRIIMETIPNPMYYKDIDGRYSGCNLAFEEFVGRSRSEIIGSTVYEFAPKDFADDYTGNDRELFANPGKQSHILPVVRADGKIREVSFSKATLTDEQGNPVGLVGIMSDITDQVRAREQAELASRAKSQFLANMSHEIRTPMNGVIGMTTLLLDTDLDTTQRQYIETIRTSGDSLLHVINDILDYSKIEAGKLLMQLGEFDLREMLADCVSMLQLRADEKKLKLHCNLGERIPPWVVSDQERIKQILLNLAGNAIKFTPQGSVTISVTETKRQGDIITLHFAVRDTGIGIAADQLHLLFESFSQVDGSYTRRFGGTGLGLAISKQLVELLGGEIEVESNLGEGSEFSFSLELHLAELTERGRENGTTPAESRHDSRTILLVEDNSINMQVTLGILAKLGYSYVMTARNGVEALQLLESQPVDLVLMDLSMPEMDGFEATLYLRSLRAGALNAQVPVIALTAHAMRGDRERCLEVGMNGYLSKPLDPTALDKELNEVWKSGNRTKMLTEAVEADAVQDLVDKEMVLDYDGFVERMMDDREIADTILLEMDQEIILLLGELHQFVEEGESKQVEKQAHKMKGAAANVGAHYLNRIFAEMEKAGAIEDWTEINRLLPLAIDGVRELQEEIAKI